MSEIYAIWFGGHTRKLEKFWIFELACGPGSRKIENQKIKRCLRKFADFCENLHIFAKFAHFCENLQIFAKICTLLRKFADFCENFQIFAKICRFLRKFADFCENLYFFAKICRFLRKFANFCESLQIFCEHVSIFARKSWAGTTRFVNNLRMLDIFGLSDGFCERDSCVKIRDFYGYLIELCNLRRTRKKLEK